MSILLIRHGETELNATRVVQFPETPLGQNGLGQAEQLAQRMAEHRVERILTSDYARAQTTAEKVMHKTSAELLTSELLRERHFGDLRGQAYERLEGIDIFARDYHPPGGETWEEFDARVDKAWDEMKSHAADVDGDLVVVTHGLVLRSLLERLIDLNGFELGDDLVVANTSVTEVSANAPWQLRRLACVAHLEFGPNDVGAV
ncbi:MAG: histidine phosphatase family protein [Gammaproteobacteria bacterium]